MLLVVVAEASTLGEDQEGASEQMAPCHQKPPLGVEEDLGQEGRRGKQLVKLKVCNKQRVLWLLNGAGPSRHLAQRQQKPHFTQFNRGSIILLVVWLCWPA